LTDRAGMQAGSGSESSLVTHSQDGHLRKDGRSPEQLRPVRFVRGVSKFAEGSVLAQMGDTLVLCTASVEDRVPQWLRGRGQGWVTAEYSLLPRSTHERTPREAESGRLSGRTSEIKRLIGRALRAVVRTELMGEKQVIVDCDVLQADGGTRTAAISGAFVALYDAFAWMVREGWCDQIPLLDTCAAVSVGIVDSVPMLDLTYEEDSRAEVDMNVIMTGGGRIVEVQGTAEGLPFTKRELDELLGLAEWGIGSLIACQLESLGLQSSPTTTFEFPLPGRLFPYRTSLPQPPPLPRPAPEVDLASVVSDIGRQ
jgi:ribonuclease PH